MNSSLVSRKSIATALVALLLVTSCASYQVIEPREEAVQSKLKTGDTVRVITIDGRKMELKALDITPEALIGKDPATYEDRKVLFDEIATLEKKTLNRIKTDVLVYGTIAIVLLVLSNNSGTLQTSE